MHVSTRLREAIYAHAGAGTAILHVPKAAGTSVEAALRRRYPVLSLDDVEGLHQPGCSCGSAQCRARARHEHRFLASLKRDRPWILWLGHRAMSREEVRDLPAPMPVIVPLRHSAERLVSYFRFYWSMAEAAQRSRYLVTRRRAISWTIAPASTRAKIPLLTCEPRLVEIVRDFQMKPATYLGPEGREILWRAWLADALAPGSTPFLYRDLLPGLDSTDDPRWSRVHPMSVAELVGWIESEFGAAVGHKNRYERPLQRYDVESALAEASPTAHTLVEPDETIWQRLRAAACAPSGASAC